MYTVVSLFSGGGGLDLGFIRHKYKILWAIDIDPNAVETYRYNIGNHIICADINDIDASYIPKADVVIGGPPCQSFSLAGKRDINDARGQLVWKYIDIIKHVRPKAFVFENVTGLISARSRQGTKILDDLIEAFQNMEYTINYEIMNAADYGVPQKRRRVIIVGMKGNAKFNFPSPTHSEDGKIGRKYISVEEALDDLPPASEDIHSILEYVDEPKTDYQKLMRKDNDSVTEHFISKMSELDKFIVKYVKPGGNYRDIPDDIPSNRIRRIKKEGGRTTCYGRLSPNKPAYTINTYFNRPNVGCNIHYKYDRLITVREALRLQSFPDNYQLITKNKQSKYTIVGNAVPPLLAEAIAKKLFFELTEKVCD